MNSGRDEGESALSINSC